MGIIKGKLYYKAKGTSKQDLEMMKEMDKEHMDNPGEGVIGLTDWLRFQGYSIDLTYIPMRKGFMYLTAIIDVYSRYIVGWGLDNSLDSSNCIEVLQSAIRRHGCPEVINSDQGCQFTCRDWAEACRTSGIRVSMDGRRRCLDNIWIERFWRTIKRNYIYLFPEENGQDLYRGIKRFIGKYNYRRPHQGIAHRTPFQVYSAVVE